MPPSASPPLTRASSRLRSSPTSCAFMLRSAADTPVWMTSCSGDGGGTEGWGWWVGRGRDCWGEGKQAVD